MAVSVVRPQMTIPAPVSKAACTCSAPSATMSEQVSRCSAATSGAAGRNDTPSQVSIRAPASRSQQGMATFARRPDSASTSRVISSSHSTAGPAPLVPAVPMISGQPARCAASIGAPHSAFVCAREYLLTPRPGYAGSLSVKPPSMAMRSGLRGYVRAAT